MKTYKKRKTRRKHTKSYRGGATLNEELLLVKLKLDNATQKINRAIEVNSQTSTPKPESALVESKPEVKPLPEPKTEAPKPLPETKAALVEVPKTEAPKPLPEPKAALVEVPKPEAPKPLPEPKAALVEVPKPALVETPKTQASVVNAGYDPKAIVKLYPKKLEKPVPGRTFLEQIRARKKE